MKFKNFYLTESLEKVYHATDVHQMISILKNNSLELSPNVSHIETEMENDKYYFLSTMRNKSGSYFLGVSKNTKYPMKDVYFEIDYDYLKSKMKSAPVDYWKAGRKGSEEEERFWSNDDHIGNVGNFIKKIHVWLRDSLKHEDRKKHLVNLYWQAKMKKIPIFFYDNPQNFVLGKKPVDLNFENDYDFEHPKSEYVNDLDAIIKLMSDKKMSGKEVNRLKDVMRYEVYRSDFIGALTHEVHGSRKMSTSANREYIKDFIELMKKHKRRTVKEFVDVDVLEKMIERKLLHRK